MYLIQSSTSTSLCLCLCLSSIFGIAQGASLSVSLPSNFVTPDESSCVPMNQMPATTPQLSTSNAVVPISPTTTGNFQVVVLSGGDGSTYSEMSITFRSSSINFIIATPFDYAYGNNTNPDAQWCFEDDSVTSSVATASYTRIQYQSLLFTNLGLTIQLASMYTVTMVNSVDSTGNVYSAQLVLATDSVSTVMGTVALSCSTGNFGRGVLQYGFNQLSVSYDYYITKDGSFASLGSYYSLNNFQCSTLGCCTGGFWFSNFTSSTPENSCPCARPTSTTTTTTTTGNAANASTGISSFRLPAFHYLVALAVYFLSH